MFIAPAIKNALRESLSKGFEGEELAGFRKWFDERTLANQYKIEQVSLGALKDWSFEKHSGDLRHKKDAFFSVVGLEVEAEIHGHIHRWRQPIINQQEVGLLGVIGALHHDCLKLLVQAKMEPGNIGPLQLSPTVQATRSNFKRLHNGKPTRFLELFDRGVPGITIIDQLRSEQGTKYYQKRNRNVFKIIPSYEDLEINADFYWLTLGQINELCAHPNLVHLDCRSVLGVLPWLGAGEPCESPESTALRHWLAEENFYAHSTARVIDLNTVSDWTLKHGVLAHEYGNYFDVIGVDVETNNREVSKWSQPLIRGSSGGVVALFLRQRDGVLECLVQIRYECGFLGRVEVGPSVQMTPSNPRPFDGDLEDRLLERLIGLPHSDDITVVDTMLSDEGGRFFETQQRHILKLITSPIDQSLSSRYRWVSLESLLMLGSSDLSVNIELRTLICCLPMGNYV